MKKVLFSFFILGFIHLLNGQLLVTDQFLNNASKYGDIELEGDKVFGNPFIDKKWSEVNVITTDGEKIVFDKGNYLVTKNKILVKKQGELFEIFPDKIKLVFLKFPGRTRIFVPVDASKVKGVKSLSYYEVFTTNPEMIFVLKKHIKKKVRKDTSQSYASDKSKIDYKYQNKSYFYIYNGNQYIKVKPKLKEIVKALNAKDKYKLLKQFVKQNKLKLRNGYDLQKLMMYYFNELK